MHYGEALLALKDGKHVARAGWNGKGMWLTMVRSFEYSVFQPMDARHGLPLFGAAQFWYQPTFELLPFIGMKTADNKFVPWLCSQTDAMADDWEVVDG